MKKKIAVLGCAWGYDYIIKVMQGIKTVAAKNEYDVYAFMNYASLGDSKVEREAECSFYDFPSFSDFDGIILLSNSMGVDNELDNILNHINESNTPAISFEYEIPGVPFVGTDNYSGEKQIMEHLFDVHHVKNPVFLSGPVEHQENILRERAFIEACQNHGCEVGENTILRGDWSESCAYDVFTKFYSEGGRTDAVVCVNDVSAIGVIKAAQTLGVLVPDEMIVTGFDHAREGMLNEPVITTVSRDWVKLGELGTELLLKLVAGEHIKHKNYLDPHLEVRESCGCSYTPTTTEKEALLNERVMAYKYNVMNNDMHFRNFYKYLRLSDSIENLNHSLKLLYRGKESLEGRNLAVFLNTNFAEESSNEYSNYVNMIYGRNDGIEEEMRTLNMPHDFYEMMRKQDVPRVIVAVPLHTNGRRIGYTFVEWSSFLIDQYYLYSWTRHLTQNLDLVIHNIQIHRLNEKLREMSYTDALTGVYNRIGCEDLCRNMIDTSTEMGKSCAVIMVDMDKMKNINDHFGHTQGDFAIRLLAQAIKKACPSDYFVSRYGGDEFIVTGYCRSNNEMASIISDIENRIAYVVSRASLPYPLTASIGGYFKEAAVDVSFEKCIEEADDSMYRVKEQHHHTSQDKR